MHRFTSPCNFPAAIHKSWTRKHFCRFIENLNFNRAENRKLTFCPNCGCSTTVIKEWQPWMEWMVTWPKVTLTKLEVSWVSCCILEFSSYPLSHCHCSTCMAIQCLAFCVSLTCSYLLLFCSFPSFLLLIDRWNISIYLTYCPRYYCELLLSI